VRAQRLMAMDHGVPGGLEHFFVKTVFQLEDELYDVDPAVRIGEAVKEHSLLRRREREDVFDWTTGLRQLIPALLVQLDRLWVFGRRLFRPARLWHLVCQLA